MSAAGAPRPEQTFADVFNGLTFGGRRGQPVGWPEPEPTLQPLRLPLLADEPEPHDPAGDAAIVRPYTWTRGRTRPNVELQVETLVSVSVQSGEQLGAAGSTEHRAISELCRAPHSVAEIAALLRVPLGVAKVLIGDLAEAGVLTVHETVALTGTEAHFVLMERVLSGLRRL